MSERKGLPSSSGLERLSLCPGSWQAEQGLPDSSSAIAEEGTLLHAVMAGTASYDALNPTQQAIIDLAKEIEARLATKCLLEAAPDHLDEQRLWYAAGDVPLFSGRFDRVYFNKDKSKAFISELKFGFIPVESATANLQLLSYAVLLHKHFGTASIFVGVIQPRCSVNYELCHYAEHDLARAEAEILAVIEASQTPFAVRIPSERACKYCKAKAQCPEALRTVDALVPTRTVDIEKRVSQLPGKDIARFLDRCKLAEDVIDAVKAEAKTRLASDANSVPGYTLKENAPTREIESPVAVFQTFKEDLTATEFMQACKVSVTSLESLYVKKKDLKGKAGKDAFKEAIAGLVTMKPKASSLSRIAQKEIQSVL